MRCQIFSKAGLFFYLITLSFVSAAATESNINCTEIFISSEEEQPNLDNIEIIFYTDSAQKNFVGDLHPVFIIHLTLFVCSHAKM